MARRSAKIDGPLRATCCVPPLGYTRQVLLLYLPQSRCPHICLSNLSEAESSILNSNTRPALPPLDHIVQQAEVQRFVTMPWSPSDSNQGSGSSKDDTPRRPVSWADSLNATDWEHYKDPRTWIPTVLATTTAVVSLQIYRSYLRRIPGAVYVQPSFFRRRSLFGQVTSVGDGDNFHLFHTPGGRLAGWGWLRKVPSKRSELTKRTVCSQTFYRRIR